MLICTEVLLRMEARTQPDIWGRKESGGRVPSYPMYRNGPQPERIRRVLLECAFRSRCRVGCVLSHNYLSHKKSTSHACDTVGCQSPGLACFHSINPFGTQLSSSGTTRSTTIQFWRGSSFKISFAYRNALSLCYSEAHFFTFNKTTFHMQIKSVRARYPHKHMS